MLEIRQEVRGKRAGTLWSYKHHINISNDEQWLSNILRPRHGEGSEVWNIFTENRSVRR